MTDRPQNPKPPVYQGLVDELVEFDDKAVPSSASASVEAAATTAPTGTDLLPIRRIDHIRFFVGNARQSTYFYRNAFGFGDLALPEHVARLVLRARFQTGIGHDIKAERVAVKVRRLTSVSDKETDVIDLTQGERIFCLHPTSPFPLDLLGLHTLHLNCRGQLANPEARQTRRGGTA